MLQAALQHPYWYISYVSAGGGWIYTAYLEEDYSGAAVKYG